MGPKTYILLTERHHEGKRPQGALVHYRIQGSIILLIRCLLDRLCLIRRAQRQRGDYPKRTGKKRSQNPCEYHIFSSLLSTESGCYVQYLLGDTTEHFPVTPGGVEQNDRTRTTATQVMTLSVSWLEVASTLSDLRSSWCWTASQTGTLHTGCQDDAGQRQGGEHKRPRALSIRAVRMVSSGRTTPSAG